MTISAFYGLKLDLKGLKAAWLNGKSIGCSTQTRLVFLTCPFKRLTVRFFCLYLKAVKNGRTLNGSTSTKIRILPQINHQWTSLPKLSKPSVSLHAMMTPSTACAWVILARMKDRFQWLTKDEDKDKVNLYDKIVSTIYCISLTLGFKGEETYTQNDQIFVWDHVSIKNWSLIRASHVLNESSPQMQWQTKTWRKHISASMVGAPVNPNRNSQCGICNDMPPIYI